MKILVFGEIGQLGTEIGRRRGELQLEIRGLDEADFTDPETCARFVARTEADAVVNAVAYTAVDKAESEEDLAQLVNATTPTALARAAASRGLPFVHVSTDYVFDGSGERPWSVDSPTEPLSAYGRTKLAGEIGVRSAGGPHAILRTAWVVSSHGSNFVKTMLRLGAERDAVTVVCDQIGGPTPAAALADACLEAARQLRADPGKSGTYHFSGAPDLAWSDFARAIFEMAGLDCEVRDIPTSAYPTAAVRPLNSRLDNSLTAAVLGIGRPQWRSGLEEILDDLGALSR